MPFNSSWLNPMRPSSLSKSGRVKSSDTDVVLPSSDPLTPTVLLFMKSGDCSKHGR